MKRQFQHSFMTAAAIILTFLPRHNTFPVDEFFDSIFKNLAELMAIIVEDPIRIEDRGLANRNAVAISTQKNDQVLAKFLTIFMLAIADLPSNEADPATSKIVSVNKRVASLLSLDMLGKFISDHPRLVMPTIEYLYHSSSTGALTRDDYIFSSDVLLRSLIHQLGSAELLPEPIDLFLCDLLCKPVSFEFHIRGRSVNAAHFETFRSDPDWLAKISNRLVEFGVLESAFSHLSSFSQDKSQRVASEAQIFSELLSFYTIDRVLFAESITEEAKRVMDEFSKKASDKSQKKQEAFFSGSSSDPFVEYCLANFNYEKAGELSRENAALKRIRENIPRAEKIVNTFSSRVPRQRVERTRFDAVIKAIARPQATYSTSSSSSAFVPQWGASWGIADKKVGDTSAAWADILNKNNNKSNTSNVWGSNPFATANPFTTKEDKPSAENKEEWQDDDDDDVNDEEEKTKQSKKTKTKKVPLKRR